MTTPRMNITLKRIIVILLGCMFLLSFVSLAEDNQQGEKKKPRTTSKTVHIYNKIPNCKRVKIEL